jgi:hypothetical protein
MGALVLLDGSQFAWLENRGPTMTLLGAIDDASGTVVALHFRPAEDLHGYVTLLGQLAARHGLPLALYGDRLNVFVRNDPHWSLEEELQGAQHPTQFGRILHDLGIGYIPAGSPQAKGRIERLWRTLQDRLVVELRLRGLATLGPPTPSSPPSRRFQSPLRSSGRGPHPGLAAAASRPRQRAELPLPAHRGARQHRPPRHALGPDPSGSARPLLCGLSRRGARVS